MASPPFMVDTSSSMNYRSESGQSSLLIRGQGIPTGWGVCLPSTADRADIHSTDAPSLLSNSGYNLPRSQISDVLSLPAMQILEDSFHVTPQLVYGISGTSPDSSTSTFHNPESALQYQALWRGYFLLGCLSSWNSNEHAERLVSCAPWTDKSTVGLLAKMFRDEYSQVFVNAWVDNTAASRIVTFLEEVGKWIEEKRGMSARLEFMLSVRSAAIDALDFLISQGNPLNTLKHSCYLGVLFHHGWVLKDDVMYALARVARLANCAGYFQVVFYLLEKTLKELNSYPYAIQEIEQHVMVLGKALVESEDLDSRRHWHRLIKDLMKPYLVRY